MGNAELSSTQIMNAGLTLEDDLILYGKSIGFNVISPYAPAAYYCAFGKESIIKSMMYSVYSLFVFGNFEGEVFIITDWDEIPWHDNLLSYLDRINVIQTSAFDFFDYTLARYQISKIPGINNYGPIMYIDSDIIINADIRPLFYRAAGSGQLHASREFLLDEPSEWFGGRHREAAPFQPTLNPVGINSGIFLFGSERVVRGIFELTEASMRHAQKVLKTREMQVVETFDQPNLNYSIMARYRNITEFTFLEPYVVHAATHDFESIPKVGFAHFNGGIGNFETRVDLLERYIIYLSSLYMS